MRFITAISVAIAMLAACNSSTSPTMHIEHQPTKWPNAQPPLAATKPYVRTTHNDSVVDNYYWMIDYFKKGADSSAVVD